MRKFWNLFLVVTTLSLLATAVACGPARSSGGGGGNDNNGGSNNGGATPGSVWGSGGDDSSGGGGGFGFGQGTANGNNGGNNEQPGSATATDCQQACEKLGECFAGEVDADDLAACPAACADEALPSEVSCILDSACGDVLTDCVSVEDGGSSGPPPSQSACEDACDTLIACFEDIPSSERSSCIQGCVSEATSSEIACVNEQSCSGVLSVCFGVDDFDFPDENNTSNNNVNNGSGSLASSAECTQACDKLVGCYGDQIPPAQVAGAKQECQAGCVGEATSAQVQCVLSASCETFEDECSLGEDSSNNTPSNNSSSGNNDVSQDCAIACSYLVSECSEFPDEQTCYDECASWGAIDGFCFFEASCADWEQCL